MRYYEIDTFYNWILMFAKNEHVVLPPLQPSSIHASAIARARIQATVLPLRLQHCDYNCSCNSNFSSGFKTVLQPRPRPPFLVRLQTQCQQHWRPHWPQFGQHCTTQWGLCLCLRTLLGIAKNHSLEVTHCFLCPTKI